MFRMLEFELHHLGWFAFEQLCRTICREVWRQPVEAYTRGPDGGRDGAFYGPWIDGLSKSPAVLQCKHTTSPVSHLSLADIRPELNKAARHAAAGRGDVYILMTNAKMTAESAAEIENALRATGVTKVIVLGYQAICELLTEQKTLRALVPRLYGLGDLTEILDERAYAQAEAILAMMHDHLARLVPVEAHRAAHRALREHRFALLIGRPGSGKSSIAASLAIGAMDLYDSRPVKLSRIEDFQDRWNPREPNQFFWLDDGFGATQYEYQSANAWNRATNQVAAALRTGARLIVTSRDYVYAAAKDDLKISAFPLLDEASVVIEVESFTQVEREQILYNHLKLGRQDRDVLEKIHLDDLEAVARDESFLPELARRFGDPFFTRNVHVRSRDSLLDFFRRPTPFLREVLQSMDGPSRAALGLVHLRGGRLPSPYQNAPGDADFLQRVGEHLGDALGALPALDGSLLRLVSAGGDRWWQFQHPTFTDAYQLWLANQPELLAEYVASAKIDDLVRTVSCGDVGIEGSLVVPRSLYGKVASRFIESRPARGWYELSDWKRAVYSFLLRRCDREALRTIVLLMPTIVDEAFDIGLFLSAFTTERDLARLLLDEGLAAEAHRTKLVDRVIGYAEEGLDGSFLVDGEWLEFFSDDDLEELDQRVLQSLDGLVDSIDEGLRHAEGDISTVRSSLEGYEARYSENPHVVAARAVLDRFNNYEPDEDEIEAWRHEEAEEAEHSPPAQPPDRRRSIFEDLADGY
jgi:LmbE family N-acetylglucosaminyl deacetylase